MYTQGIGTKEWREVRYQMLLMKEFLNKTKDMTIR